MKGPAQAVGIPQVVILPPASFGARPIQIAEWQPVEVPRDLEGKERAIKRTGSGSLRGRRMRTGSKGRIRGNKEVCKIKYLSLINQNRGANVELEGVLQADLSEADCVGFAGIWLGNGP